MFSSIMTSYFLMECCYVQDQHIEMDFYCASNIYLIISKVSFDLYYPINLVTMFSWPPTRDTRNYQLLVICHARSNVTPLNLSFPKKFKTQKKKSQSCVKIVKLPIKKLLVLKKKVKTQQKNHIAVLKLWNYR